MDFSNYLANKLISATVRNTSYPAPRNVYLALFTTDPTKDNAGDEVDQASYNRQEVTFTSPTNGVSTNANQVDWNTATSNWGNVGWVAIMDASSAGNKLYYTALDNAKEILSGDQFKIDAGKLSLTLT